MSETSVMAAFRKRTSFEDGCDGEGEDPLSGGSLAIVGEVRSEDVERGANTRFLSFLDPYPIHIKGWQEAQSNVTK